MGTAASLPVGLAILGSQFPDLDITTSTIGGKGVYKTGAQIITSRVTTTVGEAATAEIGNLTFNDEDALAKLNEVIAELEQLQQAYPGADIYLNG